MGQLLHHPPRDADRMPVAFEGSDGACGQRAAIHDRSVQLDFAKQIGIAAIADGMVFWTRLDQPRGSFNRVKCGPARAQYFHSGANADRSVRARYDDHMPSAAVHRPIASSDCSMAIEGVIADTARYFRMH